MEFSPTLRTTEARGGFQGSRKDAAESSALSTMRLDLLQSAIRNNQVSFPSQVPVFVKHAPPDMQCRFVLLYFVKGWSCQDIAKRYGFARNYIWQVVNEWRRHAVSLGFIQEIPPMPSFMPDVFIPPISLPANAALEHSPAA
ncbi:MAG: helix-turn-helix domain-containing protein [Bryobacterales bacterium]|nr:helix-turn-helix domain-containing protein [Bryobacterales bacterium]